MKKIIIALCSVAILFIVNMMAPAIVFAGENECSHVLNATYEVPGIQTETHPHQYLIENGENGPVYGTCTVTSTYQLYYQRCTLCGYIDYSHPHKNYLSSVHSVNH